MSTRNGPTLSLSHLWAASCENHSLLANLAVAVKAQQVEPLVNYSPNCWQSEVHPPCCHMGALQTTMLI